MKKVLVIGDLIRDDYIHGDPIGISAETPTVVARKTYEESFIGGAGLVVRHLLRLGCHVSLLSVVGEKDEMNLFVGSNVISFSDLTRFQRASGLIKAPGWSISKKLRCFVGPYKMVQYDIRNSGTYWSTLLKEFEEMLVKQLDWAEEVVVADNRHGVMSSATIALVMKKCKERELKLYVDSQISQAAGNHVDYLTQGVPFTLLLNEKELNSLRPGEEKKEDKLSSLQREYGADLVLKLGAHGALALRAGKFTRSPGVIVNAVDTCGAGDAFLASYVSNDGHLDEANAWAAASTTFKGTVVPEIPPMEISS